MVDSYFFDSGIIYDTRGVILSISGMFFGVVPTLIGAVSLSVARILIGGEGIFHGILAIFFSAGVGLLWRILRFEKTKYLQISKKLIEYFLIGVITSVVIVLPNLNLLYGTTQNVFFVLFVPLGFVYPIGQMIVARLIDIQEHNFLLSKKDFEHSKQFQAMFTESEIIQFIVDIEKKKFVDVNKKACEVYGYSKEEFLKLHVFDIHSSLNEDVVKKFNHIINNKKYSETFVHKRKNGELFPVETHANFTKIHDNKYLYIQIFDVTEKLNQKERLANVDNKFQTTLMSITEGVIVLDENMDVILINELGKKWISLNPSIHHFSEDFFKKVISQDNSVSLYDVVMDVYNTKTAKKSGREFIFELVDQKEVRFIDFTVSPIFNKDNTDITGVIIVLRDNTKMHEQYEKIKYTSLHDHLTGLYNRHFFDTELKRLDTKRMLPISIIMSDVNGLKLLNDAYSHFKGDELLKEISRILKKSTRHEDIVCRWGGDEFVIILPQTSREKANKVLFRIVENCANSDLKPLPPSISLGLAVKTHEDESIYETLTEAETKMYNWKASKKTTFQKNVLDSLERTLFMEYGIEEQHSKNVVKLAQEFATRLHLNIDEKNLLVQSARYHDIGLVGIDKEIINKKGPLTKEEWKLVKNHPKIGAKIIENISFVRNIMNTILYHHERFDGTGYPFKLSGKDIPYHARIFSIIDAYDAMTSERPYQKKKSKTEAIKELRDCAGKQFDPDLVEEFIAIL
jgi:diguanylate cyclase (GGDEF)-like protein/PAS domain S-box-containing protein